MTFEWDEEKEQINIQKHGIDFTTAAHVFFDNNRIEKYDTTHSLYEDRYITIGSLYERICILTVVYTDRSDIIRIVSARLADRREQKEYYDHQEKNQ